MSAVHTDTIVALSTPPGISALGVIRLSGKDGLSIVKKVFQGKDLDAAESHTVHFGRIVDGKDTIDEVVVSLFREPKSYTKENVVEISCHGSPYIIQRIIRLLIDKGARMAEPGEFSKRAFINGQFDLAQAEAVADLIHSDTEASRKAAISQMRGGFSKKIEELREHLIHFASMIELELDFSEEDVEFADRNKLLELIGELQQEIIPLIESFKLGNVIKNGIPTVIAGKPNAGKSTLLNALLNEEKAIVSDIPGTTRDFIEDEIHIGGITFRFIDTAGIRETTDKIESIGVARTREKMKNAALIIYMFDLFEENPTSISKQIEELRKLNIPYICIGNKIDLIGHIGYEQYKGMDLLMISLAKLNDLTPIHDKLLEAVSLKNFSTGDTIVTNLRHYEKLRETNETLERVVEGIHAGTSHDIVAMDIRHALQSLGEITGKITTEDLLSNIFSKFCIGK